MPHLRDSSFHIAELPGSAVVIIILLFTKLADFFRLFILYRSQIFALRSHLRVFIACLISFLSFPGFTVSIFLSR